MKIPPTILHYWLAMNASAADATVASSVSFFGLAGVHTAVDVIPSISLQQYGVVFLVAFGHGIFNYLKAHPLSDLVPAMPPVAIAPVAQNPEPPTH